MQEFCFQVQLYQDVPVQLVADMFTKYGDVTVVKTKAAQYWVDFESLDPTIDGTNTILKVANLVRNGKEKVIKDIKMFSEADRFRSKVNKKKI